MITLLRHSLALAALLTSAGACAQSLDPSPAGAWLSHGRWSAAPKEIDRDLRSADAQILYFQADGMLILWSGTIYSDHHKPPTMSEGDAETIYSGQWTQHPSGPEIRMRKVYADVRRGGETIPGQEQVMETRLRADRLRFRGFWFERAPALEGPMQKYEHWSKAAQ